MDQLVDKVAIVTGGASGIGRGLVERFVAEGMHVVAADIDGDAVERTAADTGAHPRRLDVTDEAETHRVVAWVEDAIGPVDLFCMNAGIATGGGVEAGDDVWRRAWEVNLLSHVYAVRAVLPGMLARGGGHLLHTASAAGLLTNIGAAPYAVTKHAVVALAEWLSMTYGDQGIEVSCLCPQFVETPMLDAFAAMGDEADGMGAWVRGIAMSTADVADAVVQGLRDGRFLILPHPEVGDYFRNKANDYERWLGGMRKIQRSIGYRPPDPAGG